MHLMKIFRKGGMGDVIKFVTPDGRRVANGPTSSGPKPARAWKYKHFKLEPIRKAWPDLQLWTGVSENKRCFACFAKNN